MPGEPSTWGPIGWAAVICPVVAVVSVCWPRWRDQPARPLRRRPGPTLPRAGPRLAGGTAGRQGGAVRAAGSITLAFAGDATLLAASAAAAARRRCRPDRGGSVVGRLRRGEPGTAITRGGTPQRRRTISVFARRVHRAARRRHRPGHDGGRRCPGLRARRLAGTLAAARAAGSPDAAIGTSAAAAWAPYVRAVNGARSRWSGPRRWPSRLVLGGDALARLARPNVIDLLCTLAVVRAVRCGVPPGRYPGGTMHLGNRGPGRPRTRPSSALAPKLAAAEPGIIISCRRRMRLQGSGLLSPSSSTA